MNIVILESLAVSQEVLDSYKEKMSALGHTVTAYERNEDPAVQIERAKDADIIVIANMPLKGEVIRACKNLKFIDVAFTGVDHVDLKAAKEMNVKVSNASGYSNISVSELALGMMLSLLRNVPRVDQRCRSGLTKDGLVGRELRGKTVGIIGTGAIGMEVAKLCDAFGCRVLGYDLFPKENKPDYLEYVSMEELLKSSDIVTLHCPLNDSTRNLMNKEQFAMMKPDAILINAARGPVVNTAALVEALENKSIAGAGIDVYDTEPPLDPALPLLHFDNVIVTPHVAFASVESMVRRAEIVFDNITAWCSGQQKNIIL